MRSVFKQYGLTIIAVIVGIACIATIGIVLRSQYRLIQRYPQLRSAPMSAMEDYKYGGTYQMHKEERTIETGQRVDVAEYFKVWDSNGNPGSVEILKAERLEEDASEIVEQENGKQYMNFHNPGIYTLSLRVTVPNHAEQRLEVNIPVQQAVASL